MDFAEALNRDHQSTDPPPTPTLCTLCNRPASEFCFACKSNNSPTKNTPYCSRACQEADWPAHKPDCLAIRAIFKMRQDLYRAGMIWQKLFNIYRFQTFRREILGVWIEDGKMYVQERMDRVVGNLAESVLKFPSHMCCDVGEKQALLALGNGKDTAVWFLDLMTPFFEGLISNVREMEFGVKNSLKEVVLTDYNGEEVEQPPHGALVVQLKGTEEFYVIDLASAQYGFSEPVVPWRTYYNHRIAESENMWFEVHPHDRLICEARIVKGDSYLWVDAVSFAALERFVRTWEVEAENIVSIIHSPPAEFMERTNRMLEYVSRELELWKDRVFLDSVPWTEGPEQITPPSVHPCLAEAIWYQHPVLHIPKDPMDTR